MLRGQVYVTPTLHWLAETSIAEEVSTNGNTYREHADSLFANTDTVSDARGLEMGDTDTRTTWQGKTGLVLNPLGPGIYTRPSLRLLPTGACSGRYSCWHGPASGGARAAGCRPRRPHAARARSPPRRAPPPAGSRAA